MNDPRITWFRGTRREGLIPQTIGVLEVRAEGDFRAVFGERVELDGGTHIRLAREAWGYKDSLETRWWSLELDRDGKVGTVRNGSCGDRLTTADAPVVAHALEELGLLSKRTMIAIDDGPAVFPGLLRGEPVTSS